MIFYRDVNQQDPLVQDQIYDLEDIYQSIHNILNTKKGERLFRPDFGIDLDKYLFELMTYENTKIMFIEIATVLEKYEPRIQIDNGNSGVYASDKDHEVFLEIVFSIKGQISDKYLYQARVTPTQKDKFYGIQ
jgi:phage baseplate assembly protein W